MATDKIPPQPLAGFGLRFAACPTVWARRRHPNIIVGTIRLAGSGRRGDDGDEVVVENEGGLPVEIIVADQMGTFADYRTELEHFAAKNLRTQSTAVFRFLADPDDFTSLYVNAFVGRLRADPARMARGRRKRAFDTLFKHRPRDTGGQLRLSLGMRARPLANAAPPQDLGNLIPRAHSRAMIRVDLSP